MNIIYGEKQLYGNYRILVFLDDDKYDKSNILWYIRHMYQHDPEVEFVTIDDAAIDTLDPKRYTAFYIVPQQRKFRQEIRRRFKERTGVDLHVEMYSTMKLCVEEIMMRK
jgi:hypothetical protein